MVGGREAVQAGLMGAENFGTPRPVLVVIGPSASGKSTAVRELHRRGVVRVHPTWTTRPRRPDESAGALEHAFVSDAEFDARAAAGFFLGTVALPGLPFRYALPRPSLAETGRIDTIMARAPFIDLFADFFPHRLVYQIEDTYERACARLLERETSAHEIAARLREHDAEVTAGRSLSARVFANDNTLEGLVGDIAAALRVDLGSEVAA
jgi:ribose 1,5-bisphosphokinase PhnN